MDSKIEKIVYGKRNHFSILLRKVNHKIFVILQSIHNILFSRKGKEMSKAVVVYPVVGDRETLTEILNRLSWTYPNDNRITIYVPTHLEIDFEKWSTLRYQYLYFKDLSNIKIIDPQDIDHYLDLSEKILIYQRRSQYDFLFSKNFPKVTMIDPFYFSVEESNHMKFGYYNMLDKNEKAWYRSLSAANFRRFSLENADKKAAYIFVTGPSYNNYRKFSYEENSLKIVCNTIVKDEEFLDFIGGPDIIAFADPAFHFSTNLYAREFRELVMKNVKKYNSFILVPQATVPLMVLNYPEIKNNIIGLSRSGRMTIPSDEDLSSKPTGSIITFMMIPFASHFAREVYIIGADGRQKKENYFWKHNEKVQLTALMEAVYTTHPSFFRDRNYSNHYQEHCDYFEDLLKYGENKNVKYFSLTDSFIPALKKRTV